MAEDAATRKARQRERDRAAGLTEILVKIHKSRIAEMREIELQMRTQKPKAEPGPQPNHEQKG